MHCFWKALYVLPHGHRLMGFCSAGLATNCRHTYGFKMLSVGWLDAMDGLVVTCGMAQLLSFLQARQDKPHSL